LHSLQDESLNCHLADASTTYINLCWVKDWENLSILNSETVENLLVAGWHLRFKTSHRKVMYKYLKTHLCIYYYWWICSTKLNLTFFTNKWQGPCEHIHEVGQPVWVWGAVELSNVHDVILILKYCRLATTK
jgi:hypothetical protein